MNIDAYTTLSLHALRTAELQAEAERSRLARAVRGGGPGHSRWWSRAGRRHRGAPTRTPALS